MAIELSTAGILVKYAAETTAGTRPTTGYTTIPGIKSIPEINPEPNMLQVTPLSEEEYHRYIPGLKDLGGAIGLTANFYSDFTDAWETCVAAFETAKAAGKGMWFEIMIPDDESFFIPGIPSSLGFGGAEVDAVLETVAYITPNGAPVWAAHSS